MEDLIGPTERLADPVVAVLAVMAQHLRELADRVIEAEKFES